MKNRLKSFSLWSINKIKKPQCLLDLFIIVASVLRFLPYGIRYFAQLDDYIQYFNYPLSGNYGELLYSLGMYSSRPFASLFDLYIWGKFRNCLVVALILLAILYAIAGILFRKLFAKHLGTGFFFTVFFVLIPANFEGTYWISASSRTALGLFFTALALTAFQKYCDNKKGSQLILFLIFYFTGSCLYEQILIVATLLTLLFVFLNYRDGKKHALDGFWFFFALFIYVAITKVLGNDGALAGRSELIFPTSAYYFDIFLPSVLTQVTRVLLQSGVVTLFKGFAAGAVLTFTDSRFLYLILVVAFVWGIYRILRKTPPQVTIHERKKLFSKHPRLEKYFTPLCGLILIFAPASIFFIIANPWMSMRAFVPSVVGFSLLFDWFIRQIKAKKIHVTAVSCCILACLSMVAAVAEVRAYKDVYEYDTAVINEIAAVADTIPDSARVGIFNLKAHPGKVRVFEYHEHVQSVVESTWATTGALIHKMNLDPLPFVPVPIDTSESTIYYAWNCKDKRIDTLDLLFYRDEETNSLRPLIYTEDNGVYKITFEDGTPYADVWEDENCIGHIDLHYPAAVE